MQFLLTILLFGFSFSICFSQTERQDTTTKSSSPTTGKLQPLNTLPLEGELNIVKFTGNTYFSSSALQDVVSSLPSDLSFAHRIFRFYYRQISINPYTPKPLEDALGVAVKNYEDEYRYFDQTGVENDVATLIDVYNQYGFHNATASYSYDFDSTEKVNVLTFSVKENTQYTIDSIIYTGLESLPSDLSRELQSFLLSEKGVFFNEPSIKNTADAISMYLQNNGYYFAHYDQPIVHSSPSTFSDRVVIHFSPGNRCKIGKVFVKSDFKDQNPLSDFLIRKMLVVEQGQWYNRLSISISQSNLYNLATFDLVSIDTFSIIHGSEVDTLNLQVFLQYRKQKEFVIALPYINHTSDNNTNWGGELSVLHRNLFGAAQSVSLYFRGFLQNYSFPFSYTSTEIQLGGQFNQPILLTPFNHNMGFSVQSSFSNRSVSSAISFLSDTTPNISISTVPLRFAFPYTLPSHTFINSILFDFSFEWSIVHNYQQVNEVMISQVDFSQPQESIINQLELITGFLDPYNRLNIAHPNSWGYLGFIFSFTPTGDTRNNPFSPTSGYFFSWSNDFATSGIYNFFIRSQLNYYLFFPSASRNVWAFKLRLGHIYVPNSQVDDHYIPTDKRFFAGGANSIRAYDSRSLADLKSGQFNNNSFNFYGCGSIIEGSLEYRYRFSKPRGLNSTLAEQIDQMGVTFFIDWGNAYNQLRDGAYNSANLSDILLGIAVGWGVGFRRETPVGPIRIDFATKLYDPTIPTSQLRIPFLDGNLIVHIGLGHAF